MGLRGDSPYSGIIWLFWRIYNPEKNKKFWVVFLYFFIGISHYFLLRLKKIFFGSNLSNIAPLVNFGRDFRHKDVLDNPVSWPDNFWVVRQRPDVALYFGGRSEAIAKGVLTDKLIGSGTVLLGISKCFSKCSCINTPQKICCPDRSGDETFFAIFFIS